MVLRTHLSASQPRKLRLKYTREQLAATFQSTDEWHPDSDYNPTVITQYTNHVSYVESDGGP